ncbi:MAG: type II toxin-antitoxin system VapC family toxin [Sideroxydans sp.]|nr:type II toxin-antitoxin system VapC family toxin [Sideroxydans sp.]
MIALDTNILARLVTNDDPRQTRQVVELIDAGDALFVPLTVMLELEWVLRGAYTLEKPAIVKSFEALLSVRNISYERQADIQQALLLYQTGFDFADALHHASSTGCLALATFDKRFGKLAVKAKLKPQVLDLNLK